jgi:iron complex outermembrane receptor protein
MTFDGAPLNDPAEHALFFNNFHDFANAVDSIQIQRGVGTSSVGSPAFGGSINFASTVASESRGGDLRLVLGSYDTKRASVGYESGVLDNGFSASGRISYSDTAGYRDRSSSEHRTLFLNLGWQGEHSSLKLVTFSGDEESQLSYLAVDPDTLRENRRFNLLGEEDRDNFGQDFAQLKYARAFGSETLLTASVYYNGANGWFGVSDGTGEPANTLKFGIDQAFVGSMVTLSKTADRVASTFGVHFNDFSGDHTLDIGGTRIYGNSGEKQTANAFAKVEVQLDRWLLFGDLQARWADFSYKGDVELGSVDWTFLDPKVGVRRSLSPELSLYASVGRAQREPSRMDLLSGEDNATVPHDLEAVLPEEVVDFELGLNVDGARFVMQANLYAMEFTHEIALTGELSEIGLPLRRNVDDSYRRGFELDLRWQTTPIWAVVASANLSRNQIREWTQFYDIYDAEGAYVGSEPITYRNTRPLLSPEAIVNLGGEWSHGETRIGLMARYVSEAQLDNTGLREFRTPSYKNLDLRASVGLSRFWPVGRARIVLFVNNLLDSDEQLPSGYSYQFLNRDASGMDSLDGISFYYPLATRNAVVSLELDL